MFIIPAFLMISPFTAQQFAFLDPLSVHYGTLLFIMGVIFLYEANYALPDIGKSQAGSFASILVLILAGLSFIYSALIFTQVYSVINNSGIWNDILALLFGLSIVMFGYSAIIEVSKYKRLKGMLFNI
jgi:hypothetical protein